MSKTLCRTGPVSIVRREQVFFQDLFQNTLTQIGNADICIFANQYSYYSIGFSADCPFTLSLNNISRLGSLNITTSSNGSDIIIGKANSENETLESFNLSDPQSRHVNIDPTGSSTVMILNESINGRSPPSLDPIIPVIDTSLISPIRVDFKAAAQKFGLPRPETPRRRESVAERPRGAGPSNLNNKELNTPDNINIR